MFTRRQKTLIMELLKHEGYVTSKHLALSIGVSIRTVKSEIKMINQSLMIYDIFIESKTGFGYRMNTVGRKDMPDVNYFLKDLDYDNYLMVSDSMEGRIRHIACRLLESPDYIKSENLADELFISSSTLSHDLKQVKYIFQIFSLKVLSKPYKGIKVSGEEEDLRNCIDFLCFRNRSEKDSTFFIYGEEAHEKVELLFNKLSEIVEKYHLQYPSYSLHDIAVQGYIALKRMEKGKVLKEKNYSCSDIAKKITDEYVYYLNEHYQGFLPLAEKNRIECMIDTLYVLDDDGSSDIEYKWILDDTFKEINGLFDFDFEQEFTLVNSLLQHIKQLVKRCKNNVLIYNPLAECVLRDYLLSVDFANVLARKLQDHYHFKISIDEFSYLVLYFNVTVYSSSRMKDKSLYIYCPSSRAEEQIIREEVKKLFKEIVNKIEVVNKDQLEKMRYNGLDIIITNVETLNHVPYYVQRVYADLNHKMEFISNILIQLNEQVEGYFNIDELLSKDMFYVDQVLSSKDEYFEFLFDNLCESMVMDYGEAGYLYERVEKYGQEVDNNVVFVRSQNKFVMPFIHITFVKDMFYWDTSYAKLIIFINFADSSVEFRNHVYKRFKTLFSDKEKLDKVFKTTEFAEFLKILYQ